MPTRRSFLASLTALAAAAGLARFAGGAAVSPAEPVRRGIPGKTYFRVRDYMPPPGVHVYLDGRDVHCEASECDLAAGWARLYRTAGRNEHGPILAKPHSQYVAWGKVELRPSGGWLALSRTAIVTGLEPVDETPPTLVRFPPELPEAP